MMMTMRGEVRRHLFQWSMRVAQVVACRLRRRQGELRAASPLLAPKDHEVDQGRKELDSSYPNVRLLASEAPRRFYVEVFFRPSYLYIYI